MSKDKEQITETDQEESEGSCDYPWSDDEITRPFVLALPALSLGETVISRETVVLAAQLLEAAAVETGVIQPTCEAGAIKKKFGKPRKIVTDQAGGSGSGVGDTIKKPRKIGSKKLINHQLFRVPTCNVCGKTYASWKAVYGHLRVHKDRGYLGFNPPSSFNLFGRGSGEVVGGSSGGGGYSLGTGGLEVDLNIDISEDEQAGPSSPKIDLNKSPPQDDEPEQENQDDHNGE